MINSLVAFDENVVVPGDELLSWFQQDLPGRPWSFGEGNDRPDSSVFSAGDLTVMLICIDAPVPGNTEIDNPFISYMWETGRERLVDHKAHWIVVAMGGKRPPDDALLLSQVLVALSRRMPTLAAVGWGPTGVWHEPSKFAELIEEPETMGKLAAWIATRVGPTDRGAQGGTSGLEALGYMDLETLDYPDTPTDLFAWFYDLANYVYNRDGVVPDGDTIGTTPDEKFIVRHRKSKLGRKNKVMLIVCGEEKKPWWKFGKH